MNSKGKVNGAEFDGVKIIVQKGKKLVYTDTNYTNKFACVIDFRTLNDNTISGSGRKLIGTQAGILMEIEKEATTTDLSCHVFVIADGAIDISGTKLNRTANY